MRIELIPKGIKCHEILLQKKPQIVKAEASFSAIDQCHYLHKLTKSTTDDVAHAYILKAIQE